MLVRVGLVSWVWVKAWGNMCKWDGCEELV